jgi:hypothetical protein
VVKSVKSVMAVGNSCYGMGNTIEEAKRNMKREDKNTPLRALVFFDCERKDIKITCGVDLHYQYPLTSTAMRLVIS